MSSKKSPLSEEVRVINIGLAAFSEDLRRAGVPVVQMDWRPPAGGDRRLIGLLEKLEKRK